MKTYGEFNELEKIRIYLEYHPKSIFTDEFMDELTNKFLNYNYVRKKIKELYPKFFEIDIKNNVDEIPDDYEQVFKED